MGKVPFALTFVRYEEGDSVGYAAALLSLAPIFIIVAYAALLVGRRELHTCFLFAGQMANLVLNSLLKRTFRSPRPLGSDRSDSGMPSDHAQFMAFWAVYICLFLKRNVRFLSRPGWRATLGAAVATLALLVALSRVYLGYHTAEQVAAGLCIGALSGSAWYHLYEAALRPNAARVLRSIRPLSSYLHLRDCSHLEDVVSWEAESMAADVRARRSAD
ncbi:phosphatidic acid phosphatase type 2/haloperoxidase [Pavlovales sp. CCMP2436]|nr:phosphatidic acid phosphatase type 2/haloperoxidase [Pavlovales sp. CCMP2436]